MTRDLAIAGIAALALHGLILSLPLAGGSSPANRLIQQPVSLSILHPRAPVVRAASVLTPPAPPAPPADETLSETQKLDSHKPAVVLQKATPSGKLSTKIDASRTKKISKKISSLEASRALRDEPELVEKEISAPAGEEEAESAGTAAAIGAVSTVGPIPGAPAGTVVVPEAQAGGKEVVVSARPRYADNPAPPYPRVARRRGYEGRTLLRVEVLETGKVGGIEIATSSGFDLLDEAAVEAVKDWHFVPGTKNGNEVRQWVKVPIRFSLK